MAYTDKQIKKIFNSILKGIEKGNSLRACLKKENGLSSETFYIWLDKDIDKSKQYTRATECRADGIFEDILDIADDQEKDTYIDKDGLEQTNHNVIQRARLRVDSRKWMVGKLNPKKYGEKIQQDVNIKTEQRLFGDG